MTKKQKKREVVAKILDRMSDYKSGEAKESRAINRRIEKRKF
jgi:hypothetical protein